MKYVLFGLLALTLTGCTVATHKSGDYASFSIMADNFARGDICTSFSIIEENELLRQLNDPSIDVLLIEDHLVEKYGKNVVVDCYVKIVDHHNNKLHKIVKALDGPVAESNELY